VDRIVADTPTVDTAQDIAAAHREGTEAVPCTGPPVMAHTVADTGARRIPHTAGFPIQGYMEPIPPPEHMVIAMGHTVADTGSRLIPYMAGALH
jgi:hypothetical protein